MPAPIAWNKLVQFGPFRWEGLALWRAARVAVGVVVPLGLGWVSGHIQYGAYAALGALPAGVTSFQGETRSRVIVVVLASLGMAVSTFIGATTAAAWPWMLVPVVAIWGFFTGLSACLGPAPNIAVLQWSIALLIAVGLPSGPREAAVRAGLVLAGGLLQSALVAASWALRPGATERMDYFQMPGYSYEGYDYDGMFVWFSFKKPCVRLHVRPPVIEDHKKELSGCATTKAIVSFPADSAISMALVKKLVKASLRVMKEKSK